MGWPSGAVAGVLLLLLTAAPVATEAVDLEAEFAKGTTIFGIQVGGGVQNNIENHPTISDISFVNFTPRLSYLPFEPFGSGWYRSALEPGFEGWFQYYLSPRHATAQGLKLALRYHLIGIGPLVPYIEATAGAAGTNLRVMEINSNFTFVLEAGAGLSIFVAPGVSLNAGYRWQHVSNGKTSTPNRGFNSHTGVLGVNVFFH